MDTRSFRIVLCGLLVLVIGSLGGVAVLSAMALAVPAVMVDVVKVGLGGLMALMVSPPAADTPPPRHTAGSRATRPAPPALPPDPPVSG